MTFAACRECGDDDPTEGDDLCMDCLEALPICVACRESIRGPVVWVPGPRCAQCYEASSLAPPAKLDRFEDGAA